MDTDGSFFNNGLPTPKRTARSPVSAAKPTINFDSGPSEFLSKGYLNSLPPSQTFAPDIFDRDNTIQRYSQGTITTPQPQLPPPRSYIPNLHPPSPSKNFVSSSLPSSLLSQPPLTASNNSYIANNNNLADLQGKFTSNSSSRAQFPNHPLSARISRQAPLPNYSGFSHNLVSFDDPPRPSSASFSRDMQFYDNLPENFTNSTSKQKMTPVPSAANICEVIGTTMNNDFYSGGNTVQQAAFDVFYRERERAFKIISEIDSVFSDPNFVVELSAIDEWFRVLEEKERTAALYMFVQYLTQTQLRFFITVLNDKAHAKTPSILTKNGQSDGSALLTPMSPLPPNTNWTFNPTSIKTSFSNNNNNNNNNNSNNNNNNNTAQNTNKNNSQNAPNSSEDDQQKFLKRQPTRENFPLLHHQKSLSQFLQSQLLSYQNYTPQNQSMPSSENQNLNNFVASSSMNQNNAQSLMNQQNLGIQTQNPYQMLQPNQPQQYHDGQELNTQHFESKAMNQQNFHLNSIRSKNLSGININSINDSNMINSKGNIVGNKNTTNSVFFNNQQGNMATKINVQSSGNNTNERNKIQQNFEYRDNSGPSSQKQDFDATKNITSNNNSSNNIISKQQHTPGSTGSNSNNGGFVLSQPPQKTPYQQQGQLSNNNSNQQTYGTYKNAQQNTDSSSNSNQLYRPPHMRPGSTPPEPNATSIGNNFNQRSFTPGLPASTARQFSHASSVQRPASAGLSGVPQSVSSSNSQSASRNYSTNPRPFSPARQQQFLAAPRSGYYTPSPRPFHRATTPDWPRANERIDFSILENVSNWLRSMRLHKYTPLFEAANIHWRQAIEMGDEELSELGVSALGARSKFLKVFQQIKAELELIESGTIPKPDMINVSSSASGVKAPASPLGSAGSGGGNGMVSGNVNRLTPNSPQPVYRGSNFAGSGNAQSFNNALLSKSGNQNSQKQQQTTSPSPLPSCSSNTSNSLGSAGAQQHKKASAIVVTAGPSVPLPISPLSDEAIKAGVAMMKTRPQALEITKRKFGEHDGPMLYSQVLSKSPQMQSSLNKKSP